jgi:hypothetical protein
MTVKRGSEHVFLGMNIAYKNNGTAEITMREYLEEAIADSGLDISRTATTPAKRTLFEIKDDAKLLGKKKPRHFTVWWQSCSTFPSGLAWTSYSPSVFCVHELLRAQWKTKRN